jgi:hypothetical protein
MRTTHRNMIINSAVMAFLGFCLAGCVYISHYSQVKELKNLAASEDDIQKYLKKQENGFSALRDDLRNNRLKKGLSKKEIISRYGCPIFCKNPGNRPEIKETCLYRRPTEYFYTDEVYLYFDNKEKLYDWEFIPRNPAD